MDANTKLLGGPSVAWLIGLAAFLSPHALIPGAHAQTGVLEEVVVTARKRPESMQDAPLAVTAFTGDAMEDRGMFDLVNVGEAAPNVRIMTTPGISGSASEAQIYIRGIGQQDFVISADPGVGIYIDGVYYARMMGAAMDLVDLQQVEILRGPQGTLFGRNTIGGAVNLTSRRPEDDELTGKVAFGVGEAGFLSFNGNLNLPLADGLAARLSMLRRKHDGYVEALQYDGLDLGNEDVIALRGRLLWEVSDYFELDFIADYVEDNTNGAASVPTAILEPPPPESYPDVANILAGGNCTTAQGRTTNPMCAGPVQTPGKRLATNAAWFDLDGNRIDPYSDLKNYGFNLTARWGLTDNLDFKSISAYRKLEAASIRGLGHMPLLTFQNTTDAYTSEQWSQELQLTGAAFDGTLNWVGGFYYFTEEGFERDTVGLALSIQPIIPPTLQIRPMDDFFVENETIALFGQGTYDLTDRLFLTLGARYTWEDKTGQTDAFAFYGAPFQKRVSFVAEPLQENRFTPHVSLSYDFSDFGMVYASYSQGFKSGTFSPRTPTPEALLSPPFDPAGEAGALPTATREEVDAYELGLKMELLDGRMRANLAAFFNDYTDIQIDAIGPDGFNAIIINGGDAEFKGLEAEVTLLVNEYLLLRANLGLLDAEYTRVPPPEAQVCLLERTALYNTPDYTLSLGVEWSYPIAGGMVNAVLDWNFVDDHALTSQSQRCQPDGNIIDAPGDFEPAYNSGNLSVRYEPNFGNWDLTVLVRNLSNADYRLGGVDGVTDTSWLNFVGVSSATFVRPRELAVTVGYRF